MNKFQPLYLRMFFFLQQNFKYDSADHTISRYTSEILSKIIIFFFFFVYLPFKLKSDQVTGETTVSRQCPVYKINFKFTL